MPLPGQRADALQLYLSGATADGGDQPDPALSLGGHRSSARAESLGVLLATPIPGLRVDHASPGNGEGTGVLRAVGPDALVWIPPGADGGAAVPIAGGQQVLVEGADPARYLLVTRTAAAELAGQASLTLTRSFNDLFGQSDVDDLGAAGAGDPTYRLLVFKNAGGGGVVRDLRVWLGDCTHVVRLGLEQPASQPAGPFQIIADAAAPPVGVTFGRPSSSAHPATIVVPLLRPLEQVGVWVERSLFVGS